MCIEDLQENKNNKDKKLKNKQKGRNSSGNEYEKMN